MFTSRILSKERFNQPAATMALLPKTNQHKVHREYDEVSQTIERTNEMTKGKLEKTRI